MPDAQIKDLIELNTLSPILLSKYVVRGMMAEGRGRVINIGSIVASTGFNALSVYATKASLVGFTKSLAREVGRVIGEYFVPAGTEIDIFAIHYSERSKSSLGRSQSSSCALRVISQPGGYNRSASSIIETREGEFRQIFDIRKIGVAQIFNFHRKLSLDFGVLRNEGTKFRSNVLAVVLRPATIMVFISLINWSSGIGWPLWSRASIKTLRISALSLVSLRRRSMTSATIRPKSANVCANPKFRAGWSCKMLKNGATLNVVGTEYRP